VARWRISMTHVGEFQGIPPTGKQVQLTSIDSYRISDGKIAEQWTEMDMVGMMQQLGMMPPQG
jgi:predicted ester cyclase